jgi:putative heme iron utilization protein
LAKIAQNDVYNIDSWPKLFHKPDSSMTMIDITDEMPGGVSFDGAFEANGRDALAGFLNASELEQVSKFFSQQQQVSNLILLPNSFRSNVSY